MDILKLFPDEFFASYLLEGFDYESQINAISTTIIRNNLADVRDIEEINEKELFVDLSKGRIQDYAYGDYADHLHNYVYQSAAYSMSAVGMLAPFVESMFKSVFSSMKSLSANKPHRLPLELSHSRWKLNADKIWDCTFTKDGKGISKGIFELSEATGLKRELPKDITEIIGALFLYRNYMMHNGLEWPMEKKKSFKKSIEKYSERDKWFYFSNNNIDIQIYCASEYFIDICLKNINLSLKGIGSYARKYV